MSFFRQPDSLERIKALGNIKQLPKDMKSALTNRLDDSFESIPIPDIDDWLAMYPEKGQTMLSFQRTVYRAVPDGTCKTICIQPVGRFDNPKVAPLNVIVEFVRALFAGCDVELLSTIDLSPEMKRRMNCGILQYRTKEFRDYLYRTRSQRDSRHELLCVGVTMADIYMAESWNFVYSCMYPGSGLAVLSFARLDPAFPELLRTLPLTVQEDRLIIRRGVKVLLNAIGYLFGLKHCIYYNCLMNGCNHEGELDRSALYLCPICLRKLYSALNFDVLQMYEQFANLCEKYELEEERIWYQKRMDCVRDEPI